MSPELIEKEVRRRKTFAIIAHPDAGKTTLTEKLLLYGGAIQLAGAVKAKKEGKAIGQTATSSSQTLKQRDSILALPFGKRKRNEDEDEEILAAQKLALEQEAEQEKRRSVVIIRAGWRRYLLVSLVLALAVYNVALFFGDNHEKVQ